MDKFIIKLNALKKEIVNHIETDQEYGFIEDAVQEIDEAITCVKQHEADMNDTEFNFVR